ncbi:putative oligoxyloglucan-reducing end-specific xyloglucanase [Naematelia encephala]|uniref:Putative oligoxyloglucan-reducing end-specific xyloglucanase n=1 Tax=Naematelia encephala TaxID=71784 RepID=A0A1Y2AI05_9TREE|nr:putative oligoxyloglucan-reducing end-specific xyloglucanase [Naematelia encephala]
MFRLLLTSTFAFAATVYAYTSEQSYQFNSVAVTGGGYITGFIAHPSEENLMYVRSDIGSSYRWNQTLNKWIPLTDFVSEEDSNLLGTESFALDPNDTRRLYLAQGRYLTSNNSAFFVSQDKGESFDVYPAPFPMGANELGRNNGERLAVNPFKGNEIWMGTRTEGLWKSEDYAATWSNVTSFPNAFANTIGISFVIFDPRKNGTIYAGATAPEGLYYSTDGGRSWDAVPGQPTSWMGAFNVTDPTTSPASSAPQPMKAVLSSAGILYITYGDFPGPYGVSYGSVKSFNTSSQIWTDITPNVNNSYPPPFTPQTFPNGGYCGISVAADDPDTLVLTSLDRDPGPALDSLYLSRDGGKSWTDITQLSTPNVNASMGYWGHSIDEAKLNNGTGVPWLNFDWSQGWGGYGAPSPIYGLTKFGWWMSALLISPWDSQKVMYGTGATIWASDNLLSAAENWQSPEWHIQAQGIEETFCLTMTSPNGGAHLLSGFGDINGMRHEDLDTPQPMFDLPVFSNLNSIDWAGQNPEYIVRVGQNQLNNTDGVCHLGAISENGGVNWTTFGNCIPTLNQTFTDAGTVVVDASAKVLVWSSGSNPLQGSNPILNTSGPYYSTDGGYNWSSPTGLDVQTPNITADRVQAGTFYSFSDSSWYVSTDGGASYNATGGTVIGLPQYAGALPVVDVEKAGHVYLPLAENGIYATEDFGLSWKRVSRDDVNPRLFTVGKAAPGSTSPTMFIWGTVKEGGAVGLYRSEDDGSSWKRVNDEAHQYGGPTIIQGDPRVYGRVYVGTGGRGILYADIMHGGSESSVVAGTGGI